MNLRCLPDLYTTLVVTSFAGLLILTAAWGLHEHRRIWLKATSQQLSLTKARFGKALLADGYAANNQRKADDAAGDKPSFKHAPAKNSQGQQLASVDVGTVADFSVTAQPLEKPVARAGASGLTVETPRLDLTRPSIGRHLLEFLTNSRHNQGQFALLALFLVSTVFGATCIGVTWWWSRKKTLPIKHLTEGARRLARCDVGSRNTPPGQHELSQLVDSCNSLAERLADSTVSQNYVNSVFESISEGLVIVDKQGCIETVNPAFCRLSGRRSPDLVGKSIAGLLVNGEGQPLQLDPCSTQFCEAFGNDFQLPQQGENRIPVSISCTHRKDRAGNSAGYVLVFKDIRQFKAAHAEIERLANLDPLTGVLNRRAFVKNWQSRANRMRGADRSAAIVMADIDYFKRINDVHGHLAGDEVLAAIGKILIDEVGDLGFVGRYGGEEFCVALFDTSEVAAADWADRLRVRIESSRPAVADKRIQATCTMGIALDKLHKADVVGLIGRADKVLANTKQQGRNRVGIESQLAEMPRSLGRNTVAIDGMVQQVPSVRQDASVSETVELFSSISSDWLIVVDEQDEYLGCLSRQALERSLLHCLEDHVELSSLSIRQIADTSIPTFEPNASVEMIKDFVGRCQPPIIAVLSSIDGVEPAYPLGIVSKVALLGERKSKGRPVGKGLRAMSRV